eukprot:TRINITY_DN21357_c0_g1_i2.p1 TRINITY_DN21357_c0_g1~~TRINITY_DN21357_c0_g1_i2.p1  ORF type:complete len:228 (+),score=30.65 TRINITY_DN21357_c0_g1_i2:55-738(+)
MCPTSTYLYLFFFLMIRRPPRSTLSSSSAASDVYKRQGLYSLDFGLFKRRVTIAVHCSISVQSNDDYRHVIAAQSEGCWCKTIFHNLLTDFIKGDIPLKSVSDECNHLIVSFNIPNAVTGKNDKFVSWLNFPLGDIRIASNGLLLPTNGTVGLEAKVSNGTTEGQGSIDTATGDKSSCVLDALVLLGKVRLVVLAEGVGSTIARDDTAAVTSISTCLLYTSPSPRDS